VSFLLLLCCIDSIRAILIRTEPLQPHDHVVYNLLTLNISLMQKLFIYFSLNLTEFSVTKIYTSIV